jgi:predicted oxidoreductase
MIKKVLVAQNNDLRLSEIVLGFWRLQETPAADVIDLIKFAVDLGITSIDEADIYGGYKSQQYMGNALKAEPSLREKIEIISKCDIILPGSAFSKSGIGFYDSSEAKIISSVEQTLHDLNTDYLDLLLLHRPDLLMDPEIIDNAFQKLEKAGKVNYFGVSNFTAPQFDLLSQKMETPLVTNQIELSVLHYQPLYDGTLNNAIMHDIKPMIWSPLAGGELFTGDSHRVQALRKIMLGIADELGNVSLDQLALAWILRHPANALPVIGTLNKKRMQSAVNALELNLTNEQWYQILIASQQAPMP